MINLDSVFSKACSEITKNILTINNPSKKQVTEEIKKICAKYALERMPKNYKILSMAEKSEFNRLRKVLLKKTS